MNLSGGVGLRSLRYRALAGRSNRISELWIRTDLLDAFSKLKERAEMGLYGGTKLPFLSLRDLIRSKEIDDTPLKSVARISNAILSERTPPVTRSFGPISTSHPSLLRGRNHIAMLRKIDRVILRVANLPAAVAYYRDVMGLTVVREEARLASLKLPGDGTELVLHTDPDLPGEAVYYLVDDVRELYRRRKELKLRFASPPTQVSRGFRATVKDPFDMCC